MRRNPATLLLDDRHPDRIVIGESVLIDRPPLLRGSASHTNESLDTQEEEQLRREEKRRQAEREHARIEEFRQQVAAWDEVQRSRKYLAALRDAIAESDSNGSTMIGDWITWAEGYIEGLDPVRTLMTTDDNAADAPSPVKPLEELHPYCST